MKKFKKISAAALAAVLAAGSVSAVAFAEADEIREDSKYEITLEKEIVDGEDKVAVTISNIPGEALVHEWEYEVKNEEKNWVETRSLNYLAVAVEIDDQLLNFFPTNNEDKNKENKYVVSKDKNSALGVYSYWGTHCAALDPLLESYNYSVEEKDKTFSLTAYFDPNDDVVKTLSTMDDTLAYTLVELSEYGENIINDGNNGGANGRPPYRMCVSSDGTIIDEPVFNDDGRLTGNMGDSIRFKERVKITNNLNAPAESDPTESTGVPGDTGTPGSSDKQETIDATLKNVDSKDGLSGAALEKQLFGDSGWTWEQVEKIEFTSDKLFSVRYTAADGSTKTLGEKAEDRAADDGIWNTAWTLDISLMSKDKPFVKLIAKDGTADITAKVYIKKDAQKPADSDQKSTGIALAIAPAVLAAGAVIVISKKRK